jgi:hypothetical protein
MHDPHCLRLRLLAACRQSYDSIIAGHDPYGIGWADLGPLVENPKKIPKEPDVALVGRIPEGVLIVFRGTRPPGKDDKDPVSTVRDWLNDAACVPLRSIYPGDVHAGFERSVSRLWSDVRSHVERLLADGTKRQLFVTGHSKGGAMAFLAAWRLARELPGDLVIRVITFAAARPGGGDFARAFEADHRIRSTRYEVRLDLVPGLPPGPDFDAISAIAARLLPGISLNKLPRIYVGVGERIAGGEDLAARGRQLLATLRGWFTGTRKPLWSPAEVVAMHAIDPKSQYALLVGDLAACDHL